MDVGHTVLKEQSYAFTQWQQVVANVSAQQHSLAHTMFSKLSEEKKSKTSYLYPSPHGIS